MSTYINNATEFNYGIENTTVGGIAFLLQCIGRKSSVSGEFQIGTLIFYIYQFHNFFATVD